MSASFRKALKRPLLWLNAWRFKRSEGACASLLGRHGNTTAKLYQQHLRQMKLRAQREQIRNW
ncbi:hypothetical protein NX774_12060 [Massilia agilis]|uniref:Integrase n=2 Tax=Pseudomonadota TaxID=1224 RepID=A0ABT2DCS3_9BURK|nr:hypothetical protein [Massilia agilis]MCS0808654.1 hypothetical protein [Massilia agilis]